MQISPFYPRNQLSRILDKEEYLPYKIILWMAPLRNTHTVPYMKGLGSIDSDGEM